MWNSARLFIWIGLLAKQVVGDIGVFCLTVTEKKQLARKNDFVFWIQLDKHPLLRPILIYWNLEASLHSLLSFAWTFTYSVAQQINCDKILFSHTRRWYQFQLSFISLFFVFFYYFMLIYVILLLLIFTKIILLWIFYSNFFCSCQLVLFFHVPACSGMLCVPGFIDAPKGGKMEKPVKSHVFV